MVTKRIIPCLDVLNGNTVKGTSFLNLRNAGDPVALAKKYSEEGADELVLLCISNSQSDKLINLKVIQRIAETIDIPFTVGGGISSIADIKSLLEAGADKISINSSAVKNPRLIREASQKFGQQCIAVAIDTHLNSSGFREVYINGGKIPTGKRLEDWVNQVENYGAGEILFTSINCDGNKNGFDLEGLKLIRSICNLPIIISGGAGNIDHFESAFTWGADAALAAGIFHFGQISISELKSELKQKGINIRI